MNAWEKRKFKDIVTRVNQMSNDSKLPSVEFEDIVSGQGRLRKSAHLKFNTKKGISFQPRDVLFGKLRPYLHNWLFPNFHGRAVGDFWVLRANSNVFPGYLFQLVQAPRFQSIANISSGTKMPRSDWKTVAESHFLLPDVSEQKRIWQLFKVLDDLIAATQGKLDQLQMVKKALLQHLFDQSMRFKGYSDPWEKRYLKDVIYVNSGRDYKHLSPGMIPVYGTGGYMLSVNEALSYEDAIGIGRKGTIDKPYLLKAPFWTVDTLFYLTVQDNMDISFVFPLLQTIRWKQLDESTGVPSLSKKTIESVMVHVPKKEEQKNLGNLFLFVDNLIAATQSKLSSLESLKKALLQGLFI